MITNPTILSCLSLIQINTTKLGKMRKLDNMPELIDDTIRVMYELNREISKLLQQEKEANLIKKRI
jgi:hypothetical protein